jgi:hypothetical protein
MTREEIEQAMEEAGWDVDEGFSAYLLVGNNTTVSILAHKWVWDTEAPVFELSNEETGLTYWVKEIPTPDEAQDLINEHGRPADEEYGNPYKEDERRVH